MINDWTDLPYFSSLDYTNLKNKLKTEIASYSVLPAIPNIMNAFKYTHWEDVKVVILGQDPYPNKKDAMGLAFSVHPETKPLPKSLINIFKELKDDLGIIRTDGNLTDWAKQGVLLLNTCLTVREGQPNSHSSLGWGKLTTQVIKTLSSQKEHLVFILWGNNAIQKCSHIDENKHLILTSTHPSPLSAHRGFFGSKPFSQTNLYLEQYNLSTIRW